MGRHANYLNGMASWRSAVTLALGRNTEPVILKDAGIQHSHGTPSTEAAAGNGRYRVSRRESSTQHGDFKIFCRTAV
jgi:hypothetical protein